ncbi:DUF3784 domain-containing protein [Metabacillus sp. GX 13764]|uniref:DUF3784 domain-containing protein n=1 Tax=Metabacillus kandeliae TaxID=2900151 RepID=UPI001E37AACA|nr:DUF3784 domain-containing protein [Metabacillus kandeliae]MCD7034134.1 DUF3784 domain-containing protein [Metabacillus kandeliae]
MNTDLIVFGVLFLALGYFIGIKKQTWLLAGFNEKRVKNKKLLAHLVGGTMTVLGAVLIGGGIYGQITPEYLLTFAAAILVGLVIFVNVKLVE